MKQDIKRKLVGEGVSTIFGGFPNDLKIGNTYTLIYNFEISQYVVLNKYKAISFKWDKKIPN